MKLNNEVSYIPIFFNSELIGQGRVWANGNTFSWAHPDGSQGSDDTFEQAVEAVEGCGHGKHL